MSNTALGAALTIDDSVLAKIQEAENKIIRLEQTTRTSADKIAKSFRSAGDVGIQYFIDKLKLAQTELGKINVPKIDFGKNVNFGQVGQQATELANSVTKVSVAINKIGNVDNQLSPKNSVLAWQGLQKNIEQLEKRQQDLVKVTRDYENTMSRIQSGKGGVLTKNMQDQYKAAQTELATNRQLIESYRQKQQAIVNYQAEQRKQIQNAQTLRNFESQQSSLPEQRKAEELRKMNEYYRELEKVSKRQAEQAAKDAEKEATARKKAEEATRRQMEAENRRKANNVDKQNTAALNAYNRAMAASEGTITQRINKIAKLKQAEEQLSRAQRNSTQEISRVRQEIERLTKENDKQAASYARVQSSQRGLLNTSDQLMRKLALVFSVSQIQGYLNKLIQIRGEFELQNTALASILNNKDKADKLFGQITELALKSPFRLMELTKYTKQLAAYQVQYEDLYETTKMLADVSSGLGVDMQRLILAFGQVKAANYLRGTETRQFTEAGINMLGELAKYYSELEGRLVSVAEVQERQFKRMISFADVEQVFKRLTSAGGMFYQMQEKQAETLKGMVSNLNDSLDLMFNSIGEANDGTLKAMVSLVKSITDNWRIFANILQASAVGFTAYTLKIIAASTATKAFTAKNIRATASATGLNAALARLSLTLRSLTKWIKANPFTVWATGIAFAAYAIVDHVKKVEKARESYDILSRSIQSSKKEIEGIKSRLDSANTSVLENNNIVSKLKQGTEEYKEAQEKLNKAQKEQQSILGELESKYPEIYAGLAKQENGTIDMTEAQKAYNEELQKTMTLNFLMQDEEGFFNEGIYKDLDDLSKSQKDYQNQADNLKSAYFATTIAIEKLNSTSKKFADEYYASFEKIINSQDDEIKKLTQIRKLIFNINDSNVRPQAYKIADISDDAFKNYNKAYSQYKEDRDEAERETQILIQKILEIAKVSTADTFRQLDEESKKSAINFAKPFIDAIPSIKDKFMQEFVNEQLKVNLGVTIDFNNETPKELSSWQKRINEYIEKNNLEIKPIISDETTSAYFNNLRSQLKETQEEISKLQKATEQRGESSETNEQQIISLKKREEAIKNLLSAFGELETKEKKGKDTTSQVFKDRLSFFERANKEYERLLQNYSKEEARAKILKTMMAEAEERKVGGIFMSAEFDEKGTLDSFNKVRAMYKQLPEDLQAEFLKRFGAIEIGIDIEVRQDRVKAIQDQFSNLFGNYELSLELDKLGLDKDLMSQLFDVDVFDLREVQGRIDAAWIEMANKQEQEDAKRENRTAKSFSNVADAIKKFGDKGAEEYAKIQEKITESERKELEARLKQYAEYLKKSISAKAQAEIESQKEIAKIQKTEGLSYEAKNALIKRQREETVKIKAKLEWEDFKSSDVYVKLFDDLEYVSNAALNRLKQNLDMVKESMGELEPEQLKAIQEAYNKIEEQVITRNPFAAMRDAMKEVNELQKQGLTEDVLQQNLLMYDAQAKSLKTQITDIETIIGLKQNGISLDTQEQSFLDRNVQYLDKNVESLRQMVTLKKSALSGVQNNISITNNDLESYEKARMSLAAMSAQVDTIRSLGQNAFGNIKSILESVGVEADSTAMIFADMGMSMVDLIAQAVMFGLQLQTLTIAAEMLGVAMNTALGPIGWAVMALQAITMGITAIFQVHDNKRQAIIDAEQDKIDQLQRSYDELTRTIEKGVSLLEYTQNAELTQNLQDQIKSYKAMIAAEKDKKKSDEDQIKQWEDDIIDLTNQIADTYDNLRENLVGNFKTLSEELGDAIVSAFEEGGDAAAKWGEDVNDIIGDILKKLLIQKYIEPQMQSLLDEYFASLMPKTSAAENAYDEVEKLQKEYDDINNRQVRGYREFIQKQNDLSVAEKNLNSAIAEWEKLNSEAAGEIPKITEEATNKLDNGITGLGEGFQGVLEGLPESLKKYFEGESTDTMTGLSKSISGITETQADALSAITESIRFFTADSNAKLTSILAALTAPAPENPFLLELKAQTEQLRTMNSLWSRIVKSENGSIALNVRIK